MALKCRHRRQRRRPDLPAIAERSWRFPLALAVTVFAVSGPAHALGHTDVVYFLVLGGLAAGGVAVPLGLLGLRRVPPPAEPGRQSPAATGVEAPTGGAGVCDAS